MDKLELYRSIVTEILTKYSQYKPSYGQVEIPQSGGYANEQIFDRDHDRYQYLYIFGDSGLWVLDSIKVENWGFDSP
jgi:XisI protein